MCKTYRARNGEYAAVPDMAIRRVTSLRLPALGTDWLGSTRRDAPQLFGQMAGRQPEQPFDSIS